jgi:phage-related protein
VPRLEDVTQAFIADMSRYVDPVREAADAMRDFTDENREGDTSLDGVRDKAAEAGDAVSDLRDRTAEGAETMGELRDKSAEAGIAVGSLRDKTAEGAETMGMLRDKSAEADVAMDEVRNKAEEAGFSLGSLRDKALEASEAVGSLRDKAYETVPALEALSTAANAGPGITSIPGMVLLWGALIAAIAAVLPAVTAVAAGFGAFAIFAIPTIMSVVKAVEGGRKAVDKLHGAIGEMARGVLDLEKTWKTLSAAFRPEVLQVFNTALGIARKVLPELIPLAKAGGAAFEGMLKGIGSALTSSGFKQFLETMTQLVGPATRAIGQLTGSLFHLINVDIRSFAPMTVPFIRTLAEFVTVISGPVVEVLKVFATLLMDVMQALMPLMGPISKLISLLGQGLISAMNGLVPLLQQLGQSLVPVLTAAFKALLPMLINMITPNSPIISAFRALLSVLPAVLRVVTAFFNFIAANPWIGRLVVDLLSLIIAFEALDGVIGVVAAVFAFLTGPVGAVLLIIGALIVGIAEVIEHWHDFEHWGKEAFDAVADAAKAVFDWIKSHWQLLLVLLVAPFALAVGAIIKYHEDIWKFIQRIWHDIVNFLGQVFDDIVEAVARYFGEAVNDISEAWDDAMGIISRAWTTIYETVIRWAGNVINWMAHFPSNITRVLSELPGMMLQVGINAMEGLLHGIEQIAGDVLSFVSRMASDISSVFSSALKELSPSKVFEEHGRNIARGLINGMNESRGMVLEASKNLAGATISGSAVNLGGGRGGGGGVTVNVTVQGTVVSEQQLQLLIQQQLLRYTKRNVGNGVYLPNRGS